MKAWLEESWKPHRHPGLRPAPLSAATQAELDRHAGAAFDYGESALENARTKATLDRGVDNVEWDIERGQLESRYTP